MKNSHKSTVILQGVSIRFGNHTALWPLDLSVETGKTTVIIGPSGCGKSTILRLMVGLLSPESGSIVFQGTPLTRENIRAMRTKMGYVIQEGGLFPHLTSKNNVTLMARTLGWETERIQDRLELLTKLTQLPVDSLQRFPAELSGGQRQRVSLMRALMLDPDVLFLDEPLGALDPMTRHDLQSELRQIFQTLGKTVVMVTHDMGEAAFFGDKIVLLREGHLVQEGSLPEFKNAPAEEFVTRFLRAQRNPFELAQEHRS